MAGDRRQEAKLQIIMLIVKLRSQVKVRLGSAKSSKLIIPELNLDKIFTVKLHRLELGNF